MGVFGNAEAGGRATHWRLGLGAALLGWGGYFVWVWPRMFFERPDGLVAGWRTLWADWAAHLPYAEVFAQRAPADWLASHPLYATEPFDYPFMADAISGLLMRAGLDRVDAFVWPSLLTSLLLVGLLYAFYARRLEAPGRALLALTLFFTNGGLGFLFYADELRRSGAAALAFPTREYTWLPDHHIEWINLVSSELLPQRGLLLGLPLALGVLVTLLRWRSVGFERTSRVQIGGLGFLASLLMLTHAHSFLALAWICAWLLLFDLRNARRWLGFALATALPAAFWGWLCYGGVASRSFVTWFPGWLANPAGPHPMPVWLFLWLNWGVFLPLAALAVVRLRGLRDPLVWAGASLFLVCMLVRFQPNAWDNTKLLTWAHLLLCAPVAAYLAMLWHRRGVLARVLAVLLFVATTASGFLELWRIGGGDAVAVPMWSRDEIEVADGAARLSRLARELRLRLPGSRARCPPHAATRRPGAARALRCRLRGDRRNGTHGLRCPRLGLSGALADGAGGRGESGVRRASSRGRPVSESASVPRGRLDRFLDSAEVLLWLALLGFGGAVALAAFRGEPLGSAEAPGGVIEAEQLQISDRSRSFTFWLQPTSTFTGGRWSSDGQMLAANTRQGDWIEFALPDRTPGERRLEVFLTRAADYGVVRDLYTDAGVKPTGAIDLGVAKLGTGDRLRIEVVGTNEQSAKPHFQFGFDGIRLTAP
jgi:hypothetical protein